MGIIDPSYLLTGLNVPLWYLVLLSMVIAVAIAVRLLSTSPVLGDRVTLVACVYAVVLSVATAIDSPMTNVTTVLVVYIPVILAAVVAAGVTGESTARAIGSLGSRRRGTAPGAPGTQNQNTQAQPYPQDPFSGAGIEHQEPVTPPTGQPMHPHEHPYPSDDQTR